MKRIVASLLTGLVLTTAATVDAQERPQAWVAARAILDVDSSIFSSATAVGPAWGVAAGVDWRRVGVQVALDWPAAHHSQYVDTFSVPVTGLQRVSVSYARSSPSWNILGAIHLLEGDRVRVSFLAGMTNTTHRDEAHTVVTERLGANGEVLSRTELIFPAQNFWWPGLALGADVIVRLSAHTDVVVEVRALTFSGDEAGVGGIFRPAAAFRWRF